MTRRPPPPAGPEYEATADGEQCGASGWALGLGCTRGDGTLVCPSCGEVVETLAHGHLGQRVRVVKPHPAGPRRAMAGVG